MVPDVYGSVGLPGSVPSVGDRADIRSFQNSVKRSVKKYREEGIEAFYQPRQGRVATVMTEDVTARAQELLSRGCSRREVADELGVPYDTLRKAINQGRLREPFRSEPTCPPEKCRPACTATTYRILE